MNCKNCGGPNPGNACEYCGTVYQPPLRYAVAPEAIAGFEEAWQQANARNFPFLPYHSVYGAPAVIQPRRSLKVIG